VKATVCPVAIDTNILLYAQGAGEAGYIRHRQARACVARLSAPRLAALLD